MICRVRVYSSAVGEALVLRALVEGAAKETGERSRDEQRW